MAKILIVDDEQDMRDISSQILQIEGYEVHTAANADSAISKIQETEYDFTLIDLVLPGKMNGLDVIKTVRRKQPRIGIVAYSGFSGIDITEKVIRAGADNFITKPFKRRELIAVVKELSTTKRTRNSFIR